MERSNDNELGSERFADADRGHAARLTGAPECLLEGRLAGRRL
jgi:hypothetical protein